MEGKNLRAVETQRTGFNLSAEVARSHTLASVETRGRTNNVQTSNDEARSSSGNVFRRLGRGQT